MPDQSNHPPFYIGYLPKLPAELKRPIQLAVTGIGLFIIVSGYFFSQAQVALPNNRFEFGVLTEVEGYLSLSPYPTLKIELGKQANGQSLFQTVLLVNPGKMGARTTVEAIAAQTKKPLSSIRVRLRGSLIYYNGKTVLELTEEMGAFVGFTDSPEPDYSVTSIVKGMHTLKGEIIDPKCFFGVMNPGSGKTHLSCARRCIAGGIPPVFKVTMGDHERYLVLTDGGGDALGPQLAPLIGYPLELSGTLSQQGDWEYLAIDAAALARVPLSPYPGLTAQITMCR